jgi:putative ABC transport system permease protein
MIRDYFLFALGSVRYRKLRSWLTMIGVFIGIATVVALISISEGMRESINEQFEILGVNMIMVQRGTGFGAGPPAETTATLTEDDIDLIKRVRGVDLASGMIWGQENVKFKSETKAIIVWGLPTENKEAKEFIEQVQLRIGQGKDLQKGDRYRALVGYELAREEGIFDKPIRLREKVEILDTDFEVVGILEEIGNRYDDNSIAIPLEVARELFDKTDEYDMIFVRVEKGADTTAVAESIKESMRKDRDQKKGEENFNVQTSEQMIAQFNTILNVIQAVLVGIALISLAVGAVGIMNTMYTSVLERTKEIGIMKSVGAQNIDIMMIFIMESGIYGLVGGSIGIILGIALSTAVELIAAPYLGIGIFKASVTWWLIFGTLAFAFFIGVISGILPARKASKLRPVDALRYE